MDEITSKKVTQWQEENTITKEIKKEDVLSSEIMMGRRSLVRRHFWAVAHKSLSALQKPRFEATQNLILRQLLK